MEFLSSLSRNLFAILLRFSRSRFASFWLFVIAFLESSIFPIPPDFLLIPMCLGKNKKIFFYGIVCLLGSVLGGLVGYFIGVFLWDMLAVKIISFYHLESSFLRLKSFYDEYGVFLLFLSGISPIPYKLFTIFSGTMGMNVGIFMLISFFSRGLRFFLIVISFYFFGSSARKIISAHLGKITLGIVTLSVILFLVMKFV